MAGHGTANNGFGRRSLHQWEAGLLHMASYPAPPDFRVPGGWRLSARGGGVPIPPPPVGRDELDTAIDAVLVTLTDEQRAEERYRADNYDGWNEFFRLRHEREIAAFNGPPPPPARNNATAGGVRRAARSPVYSRTSRPATPPLGDAAGGAERRDLERRRHVVFFIISIWPNSNICTKSAYICTNSPTYVKYFKFRFCLIKFRLVLYDFAVIYQKNSSILGSPLGKMGSPGQNLHPSGAK
jgi:hypothetical protein